MTPPLDYHTVTDPTPGPTCAACGSARTTVGTLARDVGFRPAKLRKFFHPTGTLPVAATACRACGHVSLHVDPTELHDLAADPPD